MVQKTLDNLKQGPKEDKVAVASGIAVTVVIVLLVAWGILFFKGIQRGSQSVNLSGGAQDEFNFSNVRDAQQKLQEAYSNTTEELRQIRDDAAAGQMQFQQQTDVQEVQGDEATQFGSGSTIN